MLTRSAVAALAAAVLLTVDAGAAEVTKERQITPRVVELTIATDAFAAPTRVEVFLPTGYDADPSRRWPVTYFTAGTMNNQDTLRKFIGGEELTAGYPSIIVSPDGNSGYWSDWFNGGAGGPPAYETFVVDELIPLIDQRYRTVPDRRNRVIFGASMGGYGALMLAARHPDLFSGASSMSGAVDSNLEPNGVVLSLSSTFDDAPVDAIYGPRAEQEVRWRGHNPWDLAENLRPVDVQIRTANGVANPGAGETGPADLASCLVEGGVHNASVSLHRRLEALGQAHLWIDYGPGCHTVPTFTRSTVDTLAAFRKLLADPPDDPARIDHRAIEPRFGVWGWDVRADPGRALEFLRLQADRDGVALTGSGRTTVTTPPWYRGLAAVDVDGAPARPGADGRVTFEVDLGAPNTAQQFTPGARTTTVTKAVALAPHAVLRISRASRVKAGTRVCVRALGGEVRRARIRAGGRTARLDVGPTARCRTLRTRRATRVTVSGRDRFGHAVRATVRVRRR